MMNRLAWWICMALMTALIGGCQQPGGNAGLASASNPADDGDLRFFEPEFDALFGEVVDGLGRVCAGSVTDDRRFDDCLRDQFASAFDDSRQGRQFCDFHVTIAKFITCVAIGNTLIDVRHRLSDDTPVPAAFWREENAMVEAFTETIVRRGFDACGETGSSERIRLCVIDWFETQVELPSPLRARCDAETEEKERYGCLVEGVLLRYLQDHAPRLGAINT